MSTRQQSSQAIAKTKRIHIQLSRPIIYGSVARWLGKSAQPDRTHKWSVYVRGPKNEDLSDMIRKVVFNLHSSFEKPQRVVDKPPYEVSEVGWGEFDIGIKIHFFDTTEKPIQVFHSLQLYPPDRTQLSTKQPVVSETYDEVVFTHPREGFYERIQCGNVPEGVAIAPPPRCPSDAAPVFNERAEIARVVGAHSLVRREILSVLDIFDQYDDEAKQLERQIATLLDGGCLDNDDDDDDNDHDDNVNLNKRQRMVESLSSSSSSSSSMLTTPFENIVIAPFSSSQIKPDNDDDNDNDDENDDDDDDDDNGDDEKLTIVKISAEDVRAVAASEPPPKPTTL